MNKEAILGFTEGYNNNIAKYPLLEAALLTGVGGVGGYYGTKMALPFMLRKLMAGKNPALVREELAKMKADGTTGFIAKLNAGLGATAGLGYALNKHMDTRNGPGGAVGSIVDPTYYSRNEDRIEASEQSKADEMIRNMQAPRMDLDYTDGRRRKRMQKLNSYGMNDSIAMSKERVPVSAAMDLIHNDPFLTLGQKRITNNVLEGAEGSTSGLTSGQSIMRSALQLGVGSGAGYLVGKVTSSLFALPPITTKRLSAVGAIAGAIVNTGLFSEIRQ